MTQPDNTEGEQTDREGSTSRRALLTGLAGLGAAGAFATGRASAQSTPSGEIGTSGNPYLRAYINEQVYVGRTSDPSSPADGTHWYREDL